MAVPFTDHRREGCRPEFTQGSRDKYGRWLAVVRYLAEDGTWRDMNVNSSRRVLRIQWRLERRAGFGFGSSTRLMNNPSRERKISWRR